MWFCFGFITLISFSAYFYRLRLAAAWKSGHKSFGEFSYEVEYVTSRDSSKFKPNKDSSKYKRFLVGVRVPAHYSFTLKRENWVDRFWKWVGLSVEYQVGRDDFDKLIYVASNDEPFLKQMSADMELLSLLVTLFSAKRYGCYVREVRCHQGRLWAVVKIGSLVNTSSDLTRHSKVERELAEVLEQAAKRLRDAQPLPPLKGRDPFILKAAAVLAISSGLAVNGLMQLLLVGMDDVSVVDSTQLWLYAGGGAFLLLVALFALALILLGRSARAHLVFIELLLVGSIGAVMTVFWAVRDINVELDSKPIVPVSAKVVDKSISKSRKGGTRYYLETVPQTELGSTSRLTVSSEFYADTQIGDFLVIDAHPGYLGIRWFDTIRRAPIP